MAPQASQDDAKPAAPPGPDAPTAVEPPPPPSHGMQRNTSFVGTVDVGLALRDGPPRYDAWYRELAVPALFGTLMGVAVSVKEAWGFTAAGLVLLMAVGPRWISSTYTLWNWTVLLGQIADRAVRGRAGAVPRMLPFLVVNSWAIFTSFNFNALHHRRHFAELAERLQYSMVKFHLMNTLGHFVPPVIATTWFVAWVAASPAARETTCAWTTPTDAHALAQSPWLHGALFFDLRVASLMYHLCWALRVGGGLRLDHVYLKRPKHHWYLSWSVAALTHVAVGLVVRDACLRGLPLLASSSDAAAAAAADVEGLRRLNATTTTTTTTCGDAFSCAAPAVESSSRGAPLWLASVFGASSASVVPH